MHHCLFKIKHLLYQNISSDSRRLAPNSDLARITAERFDILLHPAHRRALVTQC